ncbi:ABC transporter permease [Nitriliruptor alkaliphilus]|uniref:ABC transporter permease n=1 Tax=Nitriliruptor alkaliphilus TaxID=427918 RepID=UPI000698FAD4|nr:ABC transporter permease subunit [Nitriliruptor alkaliphilus]
MTVGVATADLRRRAAKPGAAVLGTALILVTWEFVGRLGVFGKGWPAMTEVLGFLSDPHASATVWRSLSNTAWAALIGFAWGSGLAIAAALVGVLVRPLRAGLEWMLTAVQAVPIIAYAPVLVVVAGRQRSPAVAAAIIVFYPVWVAVASGLLQAPHAYADLAIGFGSNRSRGLRWIFLPHAIPAVLDGLRLAASAAVIGAVIGEWFGAERGLGVVIISSTLNNQIVQLWGTAAVSSALSFLAYGLVTALHRVVLARRAL